MTITKLSQPSAGTCNIYSSKYYELLSWELQH